MQVQRLKLNTWKFPGATRLVHVMFDMYTIQISKNLIC